MQVLQRVSDQLQDHVLAWAVFLDWLTATLHDEISISRQAKRLLNASSQGLDDEVRDDIRAALRRLLPDIRLEAWGTLAEDDDSLQLDLLLQRQRF
jgi:hypothetical protein